jgi:hypothetical protein
VEGRYTHHGIPLVELHFFVFCFHFLFNFFFLIRSAVYVAHSFITHSLTHLLTQLNICRIDLIASFMWYDKCLNWVSYNWITLPMKHTVNVKFSGVSFGMYCAGGLTLCNQLGLLRGRGGKRSSAFSLVS